MAFFHLIFPAGVEVMLLRLEVDVSYFCPTIVDALAQVEPGFNGSTSSLDSSRSPTATYDSVNIMVDENTKM